MWVPQQLHFDVTTWSSTQPRGFRRRARAAQTGALSPVLIAYLKLSSLCVAEIPDERITPGVRVRLEPPARPR